MKANMGMADRIIRIAITIAIVVLYLNGVISGVAGILLLALAMVFLLTGLIGTCPLYRLLHISTCQRKTLTENT